MLNALIAIMGDSFDRAQEKARCSYLSSRAQLIAEYEVIGFNVIRQFFFHLNEFLQDWIYENLRLVPIMRSMWNYPFDDVSSWVSVFCFILLYFSFGVPIWVELLILIKIGCRFLGREDKGDLIVFYSEDYGVPGEDEKPGDDDWFGKLPKILDRLYKNEDALNDLKEKINSIEENQHEMRANQQELKDLILQYHVDHNEDEKED